MRLAAKRTLWDYHLSGYRPPKSADGTAAQTVEPPLASPAAPRPGVAFVPAPPVPVAPQVPPVAAVPVPQQLPQVAPQPGPRVFLPNVLPGPRAAVRSALNVGPAPPVLNLTTEPPVAKRALVPPVTVPVPVPNAEPPLRLPFPALPVESLSPGPAPTLPPFIPDLPPIVTPPGK